jgi:hypothetical protein
MFFSENDINTLKTCPLCSEELHDPRVLDCGSTACNICITKFIKGGSFDCQQCHNQHKVPEGGFILNKTVAAMLEKKPNEIFRSRMVEEFKSILNEIRIKANTLSQKIIYSENFISQKCDGLRKEIELNTEQTIQAIHEANEKFIEEINS